MFGQLEEDVDAAWTWIIADADWEVRSDAFPKKDQASEDFHPTPRLATPHLASPRLTTPRLASPRLASPHHEDLQRLQSGLFPDWHDPSKRHDRVLYLQKLSLQHRQYSCIQAHPALRSFVPRDAEAYGPIIRRADDRPYNAFPGFRKLGNTCFLTIMNRTSVAAQRRR